MRLSVVRGRVAGVAVGAALLAVGVGFGAAAATGGDTSTRPVSDESAVTVPAPTSSVPAPVTTAAPVVVPPAPVVAPRPVEESPEPVQAATVDDVTPKQQTRPQQSASAPRSEAAMSVPSGVDPIDPADPARGGHDADGNYIPAVPVQKPGEPPYAPYTPPPAPEKLPGEPGYVPPAG